MKPIRTLLIANRGEIAIRVMRTARAMGIRTVAVASEADAKSLHANFADQCVLIGPGEASASYLNIDRILAAAKETGADAIHPGYGFLSERDEFADACEKAGILFIGPSGDAMRRLGSKAEAKTLAVAHGVPVVPGHFVPGATADELRAAADQIGYPVMLKASAGGGGRGMRVVRDPARFDEELAVASDEALKGFGDGTMMVEKLIERPRHVEVQILADQHGQVAPLFERECSLQRRHQKLVEECPSPYIAAHPELWPQMAEAAVKLAHAAGYVGAGTVEFIVDEAAGAFYFLEVNARLQVEHPVTEAVTGLDLVAWQLRIAMGERLEVGEALLAGDRSALRGHAMEVRIVAEDPARNFLPSVGPILGWAEPKGADVRFDTGFGPGSEVSRFYDSLLAKVIVHTQDRSDALIRTRAALEDTHILGVHTNIGYILDVLSHPEVVAGRLDTGLLGREFGDWKPEGVPAALGAILQADAPPAAAGGIGAAAERRGAWDQADRFRNAR